jgi:hypothetical protein
VIHAVWVTNIGSLSDGAKQRIIRFILEKIESYEPQQAWGALLIVEQLRRGEILHKASFGEADFEN